MKWMPEAEAALRKVPFFVRKKVKARVEKEAGEAGKEMVGLADARATQKRYLSGMSKEIKGYRIDGCFGPGGCPNRAFPGDRLLEEIETFLQSRDLLGFLKERVKTDLKFHHEFKVTFADCPNACSQPQIKDMGIIGACVPEITGEACTQCEACVDICKENAVESDTGDNRPKIDRAECLSCGQCVQACPTGTIAAGKKGFRVLLGGKLGRHPRLAREIPGIFTEDEVMDIVRACVDFYMENSRHGERFAQILRDEDFESFLKKFGKFS